MNYKNQLLNSIKKEWKLLKENKNLLCQDHKIKVDKIQDKNHKWKLKIHNNFNYQQNLFKIFLIILINELIKWNQWELHHHQDYKKNKILKNHIHHY